MVWTDISVPLLRQILQDISVTPDYTDARLIDALFAAAHIVLSEIDFDSSYTVNIVTQLVDPDPSLDISFINMVTFKAALFILSSELKTAASQSISIKDGPSVIDIKGRFNEQRTRYSLMLDEYNKVKIAIKMGDLHAGIGILSPYTNINVPTYIWR